MSELALLRRFRQSSLPALADDCNRLAESVRAELERFAQSFQPRWYRRKERAVITPATTPVAIAKLGEVLFIDTTDGDVDFYLPLVTERDAFRSVAFIKRTSSNVVNVRVAQGLIHEMDQIAISQRIGITVLTWDGASNWWWNRG